MLQALARKQRCQQNQDSQYVLLYGNHHPSIMSKAVRTFSVFLYPVSRTTEVKLLYSNGRDTVGLTVFDVVESVLDAAYKPSPKSQSYLDSR